jgi:hypothetical protein
LKKASSAAVSRFSPATSAAMRAKRAEAPSKHGRMEELLRGGG